jgi:hypothetical protein
VPWDIPHGLAGLCTTVLVLMAFGQGSARLGVLQIRRVRTKNQPPASLHRPAAMPQRDASWAAR